MGRQGGAGHRLREAWAEVRRAEALRSGSSWGQEQVGQAGGPLWPLACGQLQSSGPAYSFHTELGPLSQRGSLGSRGQGWAGVGYLFHLATHFSPAETAPNFLAGDTPHNPQDSRVRARGEGVGEQCRDPGGPTCFALPLPLSLLSLCLSDLPMRMSLSLFLCLSVCLSV